MELTRKQVIQRLVMMKSYAIGEDYEALEYAISSLKTDENYVPMSKINAMVAEIEQVAEEEKFFDSKWSLGLKHSVKIINKYCGKEKA